MKRMNRVIMTLFVILISCLFMPQCQNPYDPNDGSNPTNIGQPAGDSLLILQIGAATNGEISHSFVELYNKNDLDINLSGYSLQWAAGTKTYINASQDGAWKKINLTGTIRAHRSFLILGKRGDVDNPALSIANNYGDIYDNSLELSPRAAKVVLIKNTNLLTVQNPFNMDGAGGKAAGYADMIGIVNDNTDRILGYEGPTPPDGKEPFRIFRNVGVRRTSLIDTDVNANDFAMVSYESLTTEEKEQKRPKNNNFGGWDPFKAPALPDGPFVEPGTQDELAGKLLILQAYAPNASPAGLSHPFVELYNNTTSPISLNGIVLFYASGDTGSAMDHAWKSISLDGKTIPGEASFLVMGPIAANTTGTKLPLADNYGDINDPDFTLSNNAYKIALIRTAADNFLFAQNPFTMDGDGIADGYIDMVGAHNTATNTINGYETAPARCSSSEAVRRRNLTDTNNNQGVSTLYPYGIGDFNSVRYGSGAGQMSDEEIEVRRPRNSGAGKWNPFAAPIELPPTVVGPQDANAKKLLILQIGAATDGNISHSFVELYNAGSSTISLSGYSLQWAAGTKVNQNLEEDNPWQKINLTGQIEAGRSFLILGKKGTSGSPALSIGITGDITNNDMELSNRAVKVAVIKSTDVLTVQNPFNMNGAGGTAAGYVDMVGVINDSTDQILGYEGTAPEGIEPFRITKQVGVRRTSLTDTDVNADDFATVAYAGISPEEKDLKRPKNRAYGNWNPFVASPVITEPSPTLMILQANTYGNNNSAVLGSGFARSLVELYNNSGADINLGTGNYYLHIGNENDWTNVFKLTGTIPHRCSYLIVDNTDPGKAGTNMNATPRAFLPAADQGEAFVLGNNGFKVAVIKNQSALLTVDNPYGSFAGDYIDMLGTISSNGSANGYENSPAAGGSRPQVPRRRSLVDTDNNGVDFTVVDYRSSNDANLPASELYKYWPRNVAAGAWDPISGIPAVHPDVPNPYSSGGSPPKLSISHNSGLYNGSIDLVLTAPGCSIYFSRDGSIPSPEKVDNINVYKYNLPVPIRSDNLNGRDNENVLSVAENTLKMYVRFGDKFFDDPDQPTYFVPKAKDVPKAAVIRAVAVDSGGRKSDVLTRTYFIGNGLANYANHPVISLVTEPANLVSEKTGILVQGDSNKHWDDYKPGIPVPPYAYNFLQEGPDWEREAFMEIFDGGTNSRTIGISTGVGIRPRGGHSRSLPQKGFNVYFRSEYGISSLKNYPLIPGAVKADGVTPLLDYKNFTLRNGGDDTDRTKMYDAFTQTLLRGRSFTTQAEVPCVLYLNGEYWGPYNLCEKMGGNNNEFKFGVNKDNVISYKSGELDDGNPGEETRFDEMIDAARGNPKGNLPMADPANYKDFCDNVADIDNFIDYFAAEIYLYNYDWPHNNYRAWRTRIPEPGNPYGDTRWRWQAYDLDCTMGLDTEPHPGDILATGVLEKPYLARDVFDTILNGEYGKGSRNTQMLKSLLANEEFCRKLVNTMLDLYNTTFHPNNWQPKLDNFTNMYRPLMDDYFLRWGYPYGDWTTVFQDNVSGMNKFLTEMRPEMVNTYLPLYFGGGQTGTSSYSGGVGSDVYAIPNIGINDGVLYNVTLATSGGKIKINTITPNSGWTGQYYKGNPVTVTAIPPAGHTFNHWTVTNGTVDNSTSITAKVTINGNTTITAVFN